MRIQLVGRRAAPIRDPAGLGWLAGLDLGLLGLDLTLPGLDLDVFGLLGLNLALLGLLRLDLGRLRLDWGLLSLAGWPAFNYFSCETDSAT